MEEGRSLCAHGEPVPVHCRTQNEKSEAVHVACQNRDRHGKLNEMQDYNLVWQRTSYLRAVFHISASVYGAILSQESGTDTKLGVRRVTDIVQKKHRGMDRDEVG